MGMTVGKNVLSCIKISGAQSFCQITMWAELEGIRGAEGTLASHKKIMSGQIFPHKICYMVFLVANKTRVDMNGIEYIFVILTRCGPCQKIAPVYVQLSMKYMSVTFLKVDVDQCPVGVFSKYHKHYQKLVWVMST